MKRLGSLALAGTLALLASVAAAQQRPVVTTRLTDRLYLLSIDESNYSTNSLVYVCPDGVLIVDTQGKDDATAFKAAVDSLHGGPVRYIVNTHRHVEHIGGNAIFGAGPVKIAHALFPAKLRSGSYLFDEYPAATFPDITVADSLTLFFGGERIRIVAVPGSHDDNEIMVHFVDQRLVHLSSLANGFNFPSVDGDGDALRFPELLERAMALLPHDVATVSGHSPRGERRTGSWSDLQPYHDMMARTIEIVRGGLAQGRDVAAMQRDSVLRQYGQYARSYVDENAWIATLAGRLRLQQPDRRPTFFGPVYETWRSQGAAAAVARFAQIRRDSSAVYRFPETGLLVAGQKLLSNDHAQDAVTFLEASLREYPNALPFYAHYQLARAQQRLGNLDAARRACQRALELNPGFAPATALMAELNRR